MFNKAFNLACLFAVAFDVATALNMRSLELEPPIEGEFIGYSVANNLFRRQTSLCPFGSDVCAETSTKVYCAPVCCYVDKVFSYGCKAGYYCAGTGAGAGCCPVGRICTGPPPKCVNYGKSAGTSANACPATAPVCTTNAGGAPICSGTLGAGFPTATSTKSKTIQITTTKSTTTIPSSRFALTTESTTVEVTSTTTVEEVTTTKVATTTQFTSTAFVVPTSNVSTTLTPEPPTSSSSRAFTMSLVLGLFGVGVTFFLL
ncbi:hypothetical protein TWF694_007041 [Orbilia ellipsospora]|uniref:Uncharacterized protein n=1 Tax=Orbilia ellipsospora TaxID=2528407 RepID=A0AAV9XMC5_9PEZI